MRKFLLGVLLLPVFAFAQPVTVEKKVVCDQADKMIEELTKKYKEKPLWFGDAQNSQVVVLLNLESKTWTVLQFNDKVACILESGEGFSAIQNINGWKSTRL